MTDYTKQTNEQLLLSLNSVSATMRDYASWSSKLYKQAREEYEKIAHEVSSRDLCNKPEYLPRVGLALQAKLTD